MIPSLRTHFGVGMGRFAAFLGDLHPGWKLFAFLAIYAFSLVCLYGVEFQSGVPVEKISEVSVAYRALKLFTLDAEPIPDGLGRWGALYAIAAFAAPALTATALLDMLHSAVARITDPAGHLDTLHDHIVICGYGGQGRFLAREALRQDPDRPIVIIELGAAVDRLERIVAEQTSETLRGEAVLIAGDMQRLEILEKANARKAAQIWFATGDPLKNLAAAARLGPIEGQAQVAMVDIPELTSLVAAPGVRAFDQYREAAETLVNDADLDGLLNHRTELRIAILGFGRFGRAVARAIEKQAGHEGWCACVRSFVLVDPVIESRRSWVEELLSAVCGPRSVKTVAAPAAAWIHRENVDEVDVFFLCIDDDTANLQVASQLRRLTGDRAVMVLRMAGRVPVDQTLPGAPLVRVLRDLQREPLRRALREPKTLAIIEAQTTIGD